MISSFQSAKALKRPRHCDVPMDYNAGTYTCKRCTFAVSIPSYLGV